MSSVQITKIAGWVSSTFMAPFITAPLSHPAVLPKHVPGWQIWHFNMCIKYILDNSRPRTGNQGIGSSPFLINTDVSDARVH